MSNQSFERQLRQIDPPAPDPAARLRARHAAVAEFRRLRPQPARKATSWWMIPKPWLSGFATACVVLVGASLFWLAPQGEREIQLPTRATVPGTTPELTEAQSESLAAAPVAEPAPASEVKREIAGTTAPGGRARQGNVVAKPAVLPALSKENAGTPGSDALSRLVPQNISTYTPSLTGDNTGSGSDYQASGGGAERIDRGAFAIGNTIANLRGMDPTFGTRTLTLVDGRRTVSTSNQADVVDLNVIPSNLLERMDVVTGGASATYGSGAMAGAVNAPQQQAQREQGRGGSPAARAGGAGAGAGRAAAAGAAPTPSTLPYPPVPPRIVAQTLSEADSMDLSEVQVTGTRILIPNATSTNPITTITREEMSRLGVVNVADALTMLVPQNISGYMPGMVGDAGAQAGGGRFEQFAINPVKRTVDEPESTFSSDVDTSSYSFVRREINAGALPSANAVRTEEMLNYFDYGWPAAESRDEPFKPTVTVSDSPWNEGRKLVHIGIKGYELPAKDRPDVNMVLLLDVSGSMNSPDRLPLAQRSMALLIDSLRPTDTVGIAVYAGAAGEVLPPTPVRNKDVILQALYGLRAGGSTAGVAGIRVAYDMAARNFRRGGVNRILLATDGDFNVGISDPNELKRFVEQQRDRGINLSVLGFGVGNYRDDIAQALAQNGNGVAAYIDSVNEAHKVLVQQAGAQLFTIAKDVKFQVEFNPATVAEYRLVGYETRALARQDFNNDKVDAGDIGAGHTVTAIYEITPPGLASAVVEERRYGTTEKPAPAPAPASSNTDEYGFLKIRYKLPGSSTSQLITQPISVKTGVPRAQRQDVQFATAVAGFAQLLQGGQFTGSLGFDEVFRQAQGALGEDPYGYRAEFLQLVRRAQGMTRR